MNWYLWVVVAWWLVNAVAYAAIVGKPRKPVTGFEAGCQVVWYALLIAGIFVFGTR